jgi:hypothetical protein
LLAHKVGASNAATLLRFKDVSDVAHDIEVKTIAAVEHAKAGTNTKARKNLKAISSADVTPETASDTKSTKDEASKPTKSSAKKSSTKKLASKKSVTEKSESEKVSEKSETERVSDKSEAEKAQAKETEQGKSGSDSTYEVVSDSGTEKSSNDNKTD